MTSTKSCWCGLLLLISWTVGRLVNRQTSLNVVSYSMYILWSYFTLQHFQLASCIASSSEVENQNTFLSLLSACMVMHWRIFPDNTPNICLWLANHLCHTPTHVQCADCFVIHATGILLPYMDNTTERSANEYAYLICWYGLVDNITLAHGLMNNSVKDKHYCCVGQKHS